MKGRKWVFVGIVVALTGCGGVGDEPPSFAALPEEAKVAELIPLSPEPPPIMEPSEPAPPAVVEAEAPVAAPTRRRARRLPDPPARRRITQRWITGGSASLPDVKPTLVDEPEVPSRWMLRSAPQWNGRRIGVGRVRPR